jgi:hypothetical protein
MERKEKSEKFRNTHEKGRGTGVYEMGSGVRHLDSKLHGK